MWTLPPSLETLVPRLFITSSVRPKRVALRRQSYNGSTWGTDWLNITVQDHLRAKDIFIIHISVWRFNSVVWSSQLRVKTYELKKSI